MIQPHDRVACKARLNTREPHRRPKKENDDQWPEQLRVGSGTKGWVMLQDVPVWYELWRQLNGFPPSLYAAPLDEAVDKTPAKK